MLEIVVALAVYVLAFVIIGTLGQPGMMEKALGVAHARRVTITVLCLVYPTAAFLSAILSALSIRWLFDTSSAVALGPLIAILVAALGFGFFQTMIIPEAGLPHPVGVVMSGLALVTTLLGFLICWSLEFRHITVF